MNGHATKLLAAAAIATSCCVTFAQQSNDAGKPGDSSSAPGRYGTSDTTMPATSTSGTGATMGTTNNGRAYPARSFGTHSCVGLSDRQSERACREGFPVDQPESYEPTRDRNVDDQAG